MNIFFHRENSIITKSKTMKEVFYESNVRSVQC